MGRHKVGRWAHAKSNTSTEQEFCEINTALLRPLQSKQASQT